MNPVHTRIIYHEKYRRGLNGKPDALKPCQRGFRLYLSILGVEV